jgi:peptidoglycan/xylan/chitin deacetylase (PgdA/CDA1 family)
MLIKAALSLASPAGAEGKLSILIFHRVLPAIDPLLPTDPDIDRFDQIIGWISSWFNVLPLGEAVERLKRGNLPARAAAITFDDGYSDNLHHALPVLLKHRIPAAFFISTGHVDKGLMWNDAIIESVRTARCPHIDLGFLGLGNFPLHTIEDKRNAITQAISSIMHLPGRELSEAVAQLSECCSGTLPDNLMLTSSQLRDLVSSGMTLGAHTTTHPILTRLDDSSAKREIADSRDFLSAATREKVDLFAYPNGKLGRDYLPKHAQIVRDLGFSAAVTTNWGVGSAASDPFQLPRFTPWDRIKPMYGIRMLTNYYQTSEYPR